MFHSEKYLVREILHSETSRNTRPKLPLFKKERKNPNLVQNMKFCFITTHFYLASRYQVNYVKYVCFFFNPKNSYNLLKGKTLLYLYDFFFFLHLINCKKCFLILLLSFLRFTKTIREYFPNYPQFRKAFFIYRKEQICEN